MFADSLCRDIDRAQQYAVQVAIVSQAERYGNLSIRAARPGNTSFGQAARHERADADRLLEAVEKSGVHFLMWNRNFMPAVIHAREQIAAGAIGKPLAIHADFYFAKDAGPRLGTRQQGDAPIDWLTHQIAAHADGSDGGLGREPLGELAIEGIYPLGYIRFLTGSTVRRVFARSATFFHQVHADNGVEDLASVSLEMDGGLVGSMAIGRIGAASHASGGEIKLHILGEEGALVIDEAMPTVGVYYRNQPPSEARRRRVAVEYDFLLADDFARAIDENRETILGIRAAHEIFATIDAAMESCKTGQVVDVTSSGKKE